MKPRLQLIILHIACTVVVMAQHTQSILVDGEFADWTDIPVAVSDLRGDGSFTIDFAECAMTNDDSYLYVRIKFYKEVLLQNIDNLSILLDIDGDRQSGHLPYVGGIPAGMDLQLLLSQNEGVAEIGQELVPLELSDLLFISAPTVSDNQFEIAIPRTFYISYIDTTIHLADKVFCVVSDRNFSNDIMPDTGVITYEMNQDTFVPLPYSIEKNADHTMRILTFNTLEDGLFRGHLTDEYQRLFDILQPDIICLQEVWDRDLTEVKNRIKFLYPHPEGLEWYISKTESSGVVTISRYPIIEYEIKNRVTFSQIQLPQSEQPLHVINAHLPCCDKNTERQNSIDQLLAFIRDSRLGLTSYSMGAEDPVILCGDMNLVGDRQQLYSLDNGDIVDNQSYGEDLWLNPDMTTWKRITTVATNSPFAQTWYQYASSYGPGILDYIWYTDALIESTNSFILAAEYMDSDSLTKYGLTYSFNQVMSDHRPLIMDFKLKDYSLAHDPLANKISDIDIWPNPTSDVIYIRLPEIQYIDKLIIRNQLGEILFVKQVSTQHNVLDYPLPYLPASSYTIEVVTPEHYWTKQFIVQY